MQRLIDVADQETVAQAAEEGIDPNEVDLGTEGGAYQFYTDLLDECRSKPDVVLENGEVLGDVFEGMAYLVIILLLPPFPRFLASSSKVWLDCAPFCLSPFARFLAFSSKVRHVSALYLLLSLGHRFLAFPTLQLPFFNIACADSSSRYSAATRMSHDNLIITHRHPGPVLRVPRRARLCRPVR